MTLKQLTRSNYRPMVTSICRTKTALVGRISATDIMNGVTNTQPEKKALARTLPRPHSQPSFAEFSGENLQTDQQKTAMSMTPDPQQQRFTVSRLHFIKLKTS